MPTPPACFADPNALGRTGVECNAEFSDDGVLEGSRSPRRSSSDSPQRMPPGQRIAQQMYERASLDENHLRAKRQADRKTSPKGPLHHSGPHFLVCYLCGQQFSKASLGIHQPQCYVKQLIAWERGGAAGERGPKPMHPDEWHSRHDAAAVDAEQAMNDGTDNSPSTHGRRSTAAFNDLQTKQFNEVGLSSCENCGRTFLPDRLVVHQRSCKPGKAAKPVRAAQPSPPPPTRLSSGAKATHSQAPSHRVPLSQRGLVDKEEIVIDDDDRRTADEDAAGADAVRQTQSDDGVEGRCDVGRRRSHNEDDSTDRSESYMSSVVTRRGSIEGTESLNSCDRESLLRAMERTVGPDESNLRGSAERTPPPAVFAVPSADALRQRRSMHETPLLRCQYCKRTFAPDRLERHEGACVERKKPASIVTTTTASAGPVPQHRVPLKGSPGAGLGGGASKPNTARNHVPMGNASFGHTSNTMASSSHPRTSVSPRGAAGTPLGGALRDDLCSPSSTHSYRGSPMETRGGSTDRTSSVVTPPPGPQHPRFCTECGQKLYAATQKFCGECGTRVVAVRTC